MTADWSEDPPGMARGDGLGISRESTGNHTASMFPSWVDSGAIPDLAVQAQKCTQGGSLEFHLGPGGYETLGMGVHSESVGSMWRKQSRMMSLLLGERDCLLSSPSTLLLPRVPKSWGHFSGCSLLTVPPRIVFSSPGSLYSCFLEFPPTSLGSPF